jgi:hypothetical protein
MDDVAKALNISHGSTHSITHDILKHRKLCAWWVPRLLSDEDKSKRLEACREHLQPYEAEKEDFCIKLLPLMKRTFITMNRRVKQRV